MKNLKQKIVVVDDDAGMNQALERLLNAAGYQAVTFSSAEALLEANVASTAACLVFDIHLPGLSGFELHHQLAKIGAKSPVIFITAYEDPAAQARAQDVGAVGYFTKPFPRQILLAAIARATAPRVPQKEERDRITQPH